MKVFAMHSIQVFPAQVFLSHDAPANLVNQIQVVIPGYEQLPDDVLRDDVFLLPKEASLTPTRRLVVLVPPGEITENILARRVWQLAVGSGLSVLYLTLSQTNDQTPYHRRRLTDLTMMTSNENVQVRSKASTAKNWSEAVNRILKPGDLLVCLANHQVFHHLIWPRRLGEQLAETGNVPVYMLGGLVIGSIPERRYAIKGILAWTASLALIIVFFGLQVGVDHSTVKPISTILDCLSIVVELYLIFKVNEWIG